MLAPRDPPTLTHSPLLRGEARSQWSDLWQAQVGRLHQGTAGEVGSGQQRGQLGQADEGSRSLPRRAQHMGKGCGCTEELAVSRGVREASGESIPGLPEQGKPWFRKHQCPTGACHCPGGCKRRRRGNPASCPANDPTTAEPGSLQPCQPGPAQPAPNHRVFSAP